jgi:hypothetical protein
MQMINVLQRLAELDGQNPRVERPRITETPVLGDGIKQLDISMPEPGINDLRKLSGVLKESIQECGIPGMGAPMPMTPASLSMSAGNANEIVTMMRGLADIASGASHSGMPAMGAEMPHGDAMMGGSEMPMPMDMDHDGDMDGVAMDMGAEPEMGMEEPGMGSDDLGGGPMGGDELADMVNKLKTGQPVKISTNMPVKVKTSNPVSGGEKDEGTLGTMAGAGIGAALGGPLGAAVGGAAGDSITGDEEDESMAEDMRVWDTSPKETTRDYNPNDFAQMFNKIKDIDQAKAATRADNPLKRESVEEAHPADSLTELTNKLFSDYQAFVNEGKKAKKDYDGDGKIETNKDEVWGSRAKAAAKAGKPFKEDTKKTMSQAAKGNEKYGKAGMQALAKAGREGRSLEPVKAKYNKYD